MKFTILTPTTGNKHLQALLESVTCLSNENGAFEIEHLIVVDGPQFKTATDALLAATTAASHITRHVLYLPYNTGANQYQGHKIYASISQIINADYILLMDEDNTIEHDHVSLFYKLRRDAPRAFDWMYCLRAIIDQQGNYICDDRCESLGTLGPCVYDANEYFIDTNCYCISKQVMIETSHIWNKRGVAGCHPDRFFGRALMKDFKHFECTREFTVNYRVGSRADSATAAFFLNGNRTVAQRKELA